MLNIVLENLPRMHRVPILPIECNKASSIYRSQRRNWSISSRLRRHGLSLLFRRSIIEEMIRTPHVMSGPVKFAAGPYVFSLRKGLVGSTAAYASAAGKVAAGEEMMTEWTCPCPKTAGAAAARSTSEATLIFSISSLPNGKACTILH